MTLLPRLTGRELTAFARLFPAFLLRLLLTFSA
jgi:hypothetical protein